MHMHSISAEVEIGKVDARFDKETGKKIATTFLKSGEKGICVVKVHYVATQCKEPVCLEKFDFMPSLGRFTLRDEGK